MHKLIRHALLVAGAFLLTGSAFAQTCASPIPWHVDPSGVPALTPDLCAGSDSVALYCDILDSSGKNDAIYTMTFAQGYTSTSLTVGGASAGFNPVAYLYSAACATGSGCLETGDPSSNMPLVGIAPGTYFLGVSAASADAAGACGVPILTTNGYFPVSLQTFSVE